MSNSYYNYTSGQPITLSRGSSSPIRTEFTAIGAGFDALAAGLPAAIQAALGTSGLLTNWTSSTTNTIGVGTQTFSIQTGLSIVAGMTMKAAITSSPTNSMTGDVISYNPTTGSLSMDVTYAGISGSGTSSAWTGSLANLLTVENPAISPLKIYLYNNF